MGRQQGWRIELSPKQPVPRVAESGQNVADVVQSAVNRGGEDRQRRIFFADARDAFRRGDEADEADVFGALLA